MNIYRKQLIARVCDSNVVATEPSEWLTYEVTNGHALKCSVAYNGERFAESNAYNEAASKLGSDFEAVLHFIRANHEVIKAL